MRRYGPVVVGNDSLAVQVSARAARPAVRVIERRGASSMDTIKDRTRR